MCHSKWTYTQSNFLMIKMEEKESFLEIKMEQRSTTTGTVHVHIARSSNDQA